MEPPKDRHEPRYECLHCRDTGLVEIYNAAFIRDCRKAIGELAAMKDRAAARRKLAELHRTWREDQKSSPWGGFSGDAICFCTTGQQRMGHMRARSTKDKRLAKILETIDTYAPNRRCKLVDGNPHEIDDWFMNRPPVEAQEWDADAWT